MKFKVLALTIFLGFAAFVTPVYNTVVAEVELDAGLSVDKAKVERGETVTYTFEVTNTISEAIDPVFVAPGMNGEHAFSPYVDYILGSTSASKTGHAPVNVTDNWLSDGLNLGRLDPGETVTVTFKAQVREDSPDNAYIESVINLKKTWLEGANKWVQCAASSTLEGEVLGEEDVLPETGPADVIATSALLGYLGILLRKLKLTRYF